MIFSIFHFNIQAHDTSLCFINELTIESPSSPKNLSDEGSTHFSSIAFSRGSQLSHYSDEDIDTVSESDSNSKTDSLPQITEASDGLDDNVSEKDDSNSECELIPRVFIRHYLSRRTTFPLLILKNSNGDIIPLLNGKIKVVETFAFSIEDELREMFLPFENIRSINFEWKEGHITFINDEGITTNSQNYSQVFRWDELKYIEIIMQ